MTSTYSPTPSRNRFLEPLDHGALIRRRGQLDHDLPCGAVRTGDEVSRDIAELGDSPSAVELTMQLDSGVFPKIEPVAERSAADTFAAVAIGPGRQTAAGRRHGSTWM